MAKRPAKKNTVLQARVTPELHDEFRALATSQDLTVAQILRRLCVAALRDAKQSMPTR
jgi:hypothetical protein